MDDNFVQISSHQPLTLRSVASSILKSSENKDEILEENEIPTNWDGEEIDESNTEEVNKEVQECDSNSTNMFNPISNVSSHFNSLYAILAYGECVFLPI